ESSIGAGVRRVEALVGHDAYAYLAKEHLLINSLTEILKGCKAEDLPQRISELLDKVKIMEKEIASARSAKAMASIGDLAKKVKKINQSNLVIEKLEDEISVDDLRTLAINLRAKIESSIVVLATINSGKPMIVAAVSAEAIKIGVKAGSLIKLGSEILGGGGGGKDDFAQGGGSDSNLIPKALNEITSFIAEKSK
ncbi:MAG: alanine--tRNA ligase, partial [Actinobacteria bacterium]|nr:alanine--tRNA ligase [Actinomycetota bacterium]